MGTVSGAWIAHRVNLPSRTSVAGRFCLSCFKTSGRCSQAWTFHPQSDFSSQGYLFSFVVIALGNVSLIAGLLWIWLRIYGWAEGAALWSGRVAGAYTTAAEVLAGLARMIFGLFK